MKPITTFAQLHLRFKVREHTRTHGRKPTRTEYFRLQYAVNIEKRQEDKRRSLRRKVVEKLIEEVRNECAS